MLRAKHFFLSRQRRDAPIEANFALSEQFLVPRERRCPLRESKSPLEEHLSVPQEDILLRKRVFSSARGDSPLKEDILLSQEEFSVDDALKREVSSLACRRRARAARCSRANHPRRRRTAKDLKMRRSR